MSKENLHNTNQQQSTTYYYKEVLSVREAISYLDISESLLYKLTSGRKIKFFKPNKGKIYFRKTDLDQWMLQNGIDSKI